MAGGPPVELRPDIRLVIATLAGGGSERVCVTLANQWAAEGRRVEILLVRRTGVFLGSLDVRIRVSSAEKPRLRQALWWFRGQLNKWPDVPALLFGFDFGVGLGALKRLGMIAAPLIYREGSCPLRNISRRSHWKYLVFVGGVEGVIAQSQHAVRSLQRLGIRSPATAVIWNPLAAFQLAPVRVCRTAANGPRLVAAGRLSPEKGFLRLIDAAARLRIQHPGLALTIVGEGRQRAELEARITELGLEGSVSLPGFAASLEGLFHAADYFVLSSHYEGQPNALLEALAAGTRIMAAGGEPVRELLAELSLSECWLSDEDFGEGFGDKLRQVLAVPIERWRSAQLRLHALTDASKVGKSYWSFCRSFSTVPPVI